VTYKISFLLKFQIVFFVPTVWLAVGNAAQKGCRLYRTDIVCCRVLLCGRMQTCGLYHARNCSERNAHQMTLCGCSTVKAYALRVSFVVWLAQPPSKRVGFRIKTPTKKSVIK